jgi:LAO/AO transport system kinase
MEIPDVIAINKADHPQARQTANDVRQVLALAPSAPQPTIVLTDALRGEGVDELWAAIDGHRAGLEADGTLEERRQRNLAAEVFAVASARARRHLEDAVADDPALRAVLDRVARRELDPLTAVHTILETVFHLSDDPQPDGDQDRPDAR